MPVMYYKAFFLHSLIQQCQVKSREKDSHKLIEWCPCLFFYMRTSLHLTLHLARSVVDPERAFNGCCDKDVGCNNKGERDAPAKRVNKLEQARSKLNKGKRRSDG